MYIRFVIDTRHGESGRNMGLFMAMERLHQDKLLYGYEIELEEEIYQWFRKNLKVPRVLSAGSSNHYRKPGAISWFRSTAVEHIDKMRQYAQILEAHGVSVSQVTTERPGKILYEDEYQIAAIPFRDTC
jgi:hypothetical protein